VLQETMHCKEKAVAKQKLAVAKIEAQVTKVQSDAS